MASSKPTPTAAAGRRKPKSRMLSALVNLWCDYSSGVVRGVPPQFGGERPGMLGCKIRREIGYRHRLGRQLSLSRAGVGTDNIACLRAVDRLVAVLGDVVVLPSARDPELVGPATYYGANPPNPYQWVPVLDRHSKEGDVVWEIGPGVVGSGSWVGEVLARHVWLVQVPAPGSTRHEFRIPLPFKPGAKVEADPVMPGMTMTPLADIDEVPPTLVIVPLPVPLDAFSIAEYAHFHVREAMGGQRVFGILPGQEWVGLHPEFAFDEQHYLTAVVARLKTLDYLTRECGTRICMAAPMVKGTPKAVEKAIRRDLGWKVVERIHAFEEGGTTHFWDGTSLMGTTLTIWRAS